MEARADHENLIRQYLLGELSEEEKARMEERLLTSDEFFEQMRAVEQDLIDEYVRGELSEMARAQFERQFLAAPEGRQSVEFARAWQRYDRAAAAPARFSWRRAWQAVLGPPRPVMRWAWAAAGLVVILAGAGLIAEVTGLRRQLARTQTELQTARQDYGSLQEQITKEKAKVNELDKQLQGGRQEIARLEQELTRPPSILDLRLTAERSVLAEPVRLTLPPGHHWIHTEINLGGAAEYQSYGVTLQTRHGDVVYSQDGLPASQIPSGDKAITLTLPSRLFAPGEYKLILRGMTVPRPQTLGEYRFRVTRP